MLIFHPTYSLMNIANDFWRVKEPHNQLLGNNQFQCRVFNEPKSRAEMDAINLVFEQTIEEDPSTGAIYQGKDFHFGHVILSRDRFNFGPFYTRYDRSENLEKVSAEAKSRKV